MGKMGYKLKNLFKSKDQIEIEARMQFEKNRRSFMKYYQELDVTMKNFSKMAVDAEKSGNHENAKACARFVVKLQRTQIRVQGLLQRFEMMRSMQRLSGVYTDFVKACGEMGVSMDATIDLKSLWQNSAEMEAAIGKLDAMSESMDMVFDSIDNGLSNGMGEMKTADENDAEADELLDRIMGRDNRVNNIPAGTAMTNSAADSTAAAKEAVDDEEEKLRKMMDELRG